MLAQYTRIGLGTALPNLACEHGTPLRKGSRRADQQRHALRLSLSQPLAKTQLAFANAQLPNHHSQLQSQRPRQLGQQFGFQKLSGGRQRRRQRWGSDMVRIVTVHMWSPNQKNRAAAPPDAALRLHPLS
ncbi:hypothetical protein D3C87_1699490 [compost metagenome]